MSLVPGSRISGGTVSWEGSKISREVEYLRLGSLGAVWYPGGRISGGGYKEGQFHHPKTTKAGGTHPTGMLSFLNCSVYRGNFAKGKFRAIVSDDFDGWFHMTMVIVGVNAGEGMKVYHNGLIKKEDGNLLPQDVDVSSVGHLAIGRSFLDCDERYTSVDVDELLIFDVALTDQEVKAIYDHY